MYAFFVPTEGSFHGIDIRELEFVEKRDAGCGFFGLLIAEPALGEGEVRAEFVHKEGEESSLHGVFGVMAAVDEDILLIAMAMEIHEQHEVSLACKALDEFLGVMDGRVEGEAGLFPPPVQVTACERAPVIPIHNSVWVQHWHYFEDEVISECLCLGGDRVRQEVNDPLHHPRPHALARVDSGSEDNPSLFLFSCCASDGEQLARVPSDSVAKGGAFSESLFSGVCVDGLQDIE